MVKYTIEQIVRAGRRVYSKLGGAFKMQDVAKELGTSASSLYRHVTNKRELYFAMLTEEFDHFNEMIGSWIQEMESPDPDTILRRIGSYILEMARNDFERFSLMFLTRPPKIGAKGKITEPGKFERACTPQTITFMRGLVRQVLGEDVDEKQVVYHTYTLISLILGAGVVTSSYYDYLNVGILEQEAYREFHDFVMEVSSMILEEGRGKRG